MQKKKICRNGICTFKSPAREVCTEQLSCVICYRASPTNITTMWDSLHNNNNVVLTDLYANNPNDPNDPNGAIRWDDINCRNTKGWPLLAIPLLSMIESTTIFDAEKKSAAAIEHTSQLLEFRNLSKSDRTPSIESECNVNSLYPSIWHMLFVALPSLPVRPTLFAFIERLDDLTSIRQPICTRPIYPIVSILEIMFIKYLDLRLVYWVCSRGIDPNCRDWSEEAHPKIVEYDKDKGKGNWGDLGEQDDRSQDNRSQDDEDTSYCLLNLPKIGEEILVRDTRERWIPATIIGFKPENNVLVHYIGWGDQWNVWKIFPNECIRNTRYLLKLDAPRNFLPPFQRSGKNYLEYDRSYTKLNNSIASKSQICHHMQKGWEVYKMWKTGAIAALGKHLFSDLVGIMYSLI